VNVKLPPGVPLKTDKAGRIMSLSVQGGTGKCSEHGCGVASPLHGKLTCNPRSHAIEDCHEPVNGETAQTSIADAGKILCLTVRPDSAWKTKHAKHVSLFFCH